MKLKYYLRGLGIGIAVTALILGLASGKSEDSAMTDEQVIARAKELGMVERLPLSETVQQEDGKDENPSAGSDVVSDSREQKNASGADEPDMENKEEDVSGVDGEPDSPDESAGPDTQALEDARDESGQGEAQKPEEQQNIIQGEEPLVVDGDEPGESVSDSGVETVRVEIVRGDSSDTVSRKLKEAGLVVDDVAYNRYLCENGYDKSILANTYEIPVGMSESEIAALITGR